MFYLEKGIGVFNYNEILCVLKQSQTKVSVVFKTGVDQPIFVEDADKFIQDFAITANYLEANTEPKVRMVNSNEVKI